MPVITDNPPAPIQDDLNTLATSLDTEIPAKQADNLLIATWNIRSFSSLTRKWTASSDDSPKRDLRGLRAIIEILSRFDVIAVQELKGNLRALRDTMRFLGDDWDFLMTDVTAGQAGNNERLAFIFDRTRIRPSGLAAELVVPPDRLERVGADALREQFVRTPYAVSFRRSDTTFILVTLHILFGDVAADRIPELAEIADIFRDWARRSNRFHHNLICLGDFNIDREGSPLFDAFTSTGLRIPDQLRNLPRTVFDDPGDPSDDNYYDQIAWFTTGSGALIDIELRSGGNFDFLPFVYTDTDFSRNSISHRVSDHLPLWCEFVL
ncbi:endonuclease/exonuclease/phosphatase family protein [Roseibium sp. RKSG952]|uniref:endonuclease/exonuclease/phosphatase family protein n=1 Tax=Roseibium sp. RKSG952 TaxID=2529384 RepID=UPI0012BCBF97|nr:endonuclease/exonuclease/phosphatase family protein [Roseibium sp. RKSG952]MTI02255.1 endonuclease [Roseibium sp. RKSG952]